MRCQRQPLIEPRKGNSARLTKLCDDPFPRETLAGEPIPKERDRSLITMADDKIADVVAAHPDQAVLAIGMAEHGPGRNHLFESIAHDGAPHRFDLKSPIERKSAGQTVARVCGSVMCPRARADISGMNWGTR